MTSNKQIQQMARDAQQKAQERDDVDTAHEYLLKNAICSVRALDMMFERSEPEYNEDVMVASDLSEVQQRLGMVAALTTDISDELEEPS